MASIKQKTVSFADVQARVQAIVDTENTYAVSSPTLETLGRVADIDNYSDFGLKSLGKMVGFPADFLKSLAETGSKPLANRNIVDRVLNYFKTTNNEPRRPFYAREFNDKICGVVSDKYAYFDDDEVMDIIGGSPLADFQFQYAGVSPERLHLRAIDLDNPFKIEGDKSDLYMLYFVDNSMVGQASFKVRIGIYRQVCSNGLIIPMKDFVLCKAVHRGNRDIAAQFNQSVEFFKEKRDEIQAILTASAEEEASIEQLRQKFDEDYVKTYVAKKLNTNKSETEKIIVLFDRYSIEYGRASKWAFTNAVTEFARDLPESQLERRLYLESKALAAA